MNRVYYLSFAIFFSSLALPVRGQKGLDETIQKNVLLEKEIELLKKDSSEINNGIKDILIQINNDSIKYTELEKRYNSLVASASQNSLIALRQQVDSLESLQKSLQTSINSLKKELSEKNVELMNADSELQEMSAYSEIQKQQLYHNNNIYLTKRYSTITIERLTELSNSVDEFKSFTNFADYEKRIVTALNNKRLFDRVWECINEGIGYSKAGELRSEIIPLLEVNKDNSTKGIFRLSAEQINEMDSLNIRLSRLNNGIKELQKIVSSVNTDKKICEFRNAKKHTDKRECLEQIRQYIIPEKGGEGETVYERYFKMIPYLDGLLRNYWNELKVNPFDSPTKTEIIIMDLVVK